MTIIYLYLAFLIVVFSHELGHIPKYIKWSKLWIFPYSAAAMEANSRIGGLIVNGILFVGIALIKPEFILLQYVGLLSWLHFISYALIGSIVPELPASKVDIKTYVFDDVDNKKAPLFITLAILSFLIFYQYYSPIIVSIL